MKCRVQHTPQYQSIFHTFQPALPWQLTRSALAVARAATLADAGAEYTDARLHMHTHTRMHARALSARVARTTAEEYLTVREHWHSGNVGRLQQQFTPLASVNGPACALVMAAGQHDSRAQCASGGTCAEDHCMCSYIARKKTTYKVGEACRVCARTGACSMSARPKAYFIISSKQLILCSTDHGTAQPISIICIWV